MIIYKGEKVTTDSRHDGVRGADILNAVERNQIEMVGVHFEVVVPRFCQDHDEAWIPTRISFVLGAD
jgi:hypothetical protein